MKLKTLAIAIAMGSMPFAAQADLDISGDITVGYFGNSAGATVLDENGSEVNLDASDKWGAYTGYAHTEIDFGGTGSAASFEEVRVGIKGPFGDVTIGEVDNACDSTDVGGTNDTWLAHSQGGCRGSDTGNILYKRALGPATVGISHRATSGAKNFAVGAKGAYGPVGVSLGYEAGVDVANWGEGDNIVYGLTGKVGVFTLGLRGSSFSGDGVGDLAGVGVNFLYSARGHNFYGGIGKNDTVSAAGVKTSDVDSWSVGYVRTVSQTDFIFEATEADGDSDTSFGVGIRHNF